MQTPIQVTFRNLPTSPAVEDACLDEVAKLERYSDRITSCQVTIAVPHRRHVQGNLYEVHILLHVPGEELVVNHTPARHEAARDVYIAIREAFDQARRLLEDYARKQRGQVKTHGSPPMGRVVRLVPEADHGFIETAAGHEVYFHRNSVLHGVFDNLEVGTLVQFVEEAGDKGPQAARVTVSD